MTYIQPPRVLQFFINSVTVNTTWTEDDGSGYDFVGNAYRWDVNLTITPQLQSYGPNFSYDGTNVQVGDWMSTSVNGFSWQIISISSQTFNTVVCTVEDIDRFNTFADPTQSGTGDPTQFLSGFIYQLADDGLPILTPVLDGVVDISWQTDQISRFRSRNLYNSYVRVSQVGNTFAIGDFIYMDNTGTYQEALATSSLVENIVGQVTSIGIPGAEWFTFKPIGTYKTGINPALPGTFGDVIYVSATTPGGLTITKPPQWAVPVYINLSSDGHTGILLPQGMVPSNPLSYMSVYVFSGLPSPITSGTHTITGFFTVAPIMSSTVVFINGVKIDATTNYTVSGLDIILNVDSIGFPLENGDEISAEYQG